MCHYKLGSKIRRTDRRSVALALLRRGSRAHAELSELVAVRPAARVRLGEQQSVLADHKRARAADAVARDREIVADVNARRIAKGQPLMTPEQETEMLERLAARRD